MKQIIFFEKKIISGLLAIKTGTKSVQETGINNLLNRLKNLDEASYDNLSKRYVETMKNKELAA